MVVRVWLAGSLLVTLCLSAASGRAAPLEATQGDPEALITIGNQLRRAGENDRAEGYYFRAYQLAPTPRAAAQLGLVELAVSKFRAAEGHLSEALASDDSWVKGHASVFEQSRASARSHLFGVELVGAPKNATVEFTDAKVVQLGADSTLWLDPGPASINVVAAGRRTAHLTVAGKAGERSRVRVEMPTLAEVAPSSTPPPPSASPPPVAAAAVPAPASEPTKAEPEPLGTLASDSDARSSSTGHALHAASIALASTGAAIGVGGAVLLLIGRSKAHSYFSDTVPYDASDDSYGTFQEAGVAMIVGGGALVAGGIILYALGARSDHADTGTTRVSLTMGPGFRGVGWQGRF